MPMQVLHTPEKLMRRGLNALHYFIFMHLPMFTVFYDIFRMEHGLVCDVVFASYPDHTHFFKIKFRGRRLAVLISYHLLLVTLLAYQ